MPRFIFFLLTASIFFQSQAQYSQNIDTLSRTEIKNLIMGLDHDHEAKIHFNKFRTRKLTGGVLMLLGAVTLLAASNVEGPDNHEANIGGIYTVLSGVFLSGTGFVIYVSASDQYEKSKETYLKSTNTSYSLSPHIRNDIKIIGVESQR